MGLLLYFVESDAPKTCLRESIKFWRLLALPETTKNNNEHVIYEFRKTANITTNRTSSIWDRDIDRILGT